jgi:hypothetical protein
MTVEHFTHLLDAYGSDLQRWPAAEREAATSLLETSDVARQAFLDAERLDTALAAVPALRQGFEAPSPQLLRRLAEVPLRQPRRLGRKVWWPFKSAYAPMLALAAAVMCGLFVGNLAFPASAETALDEGVSELSDDEVDELAEIAFASDGSLGLGDDVWSGSEETAP